MMTNTAIVFPGQGSQSVGMLHDIANHYSIVKETFDQASDVLGYDLWEITQTGPAQELNKTVYTQPALVASSYAIWKILQAHATLQPKMLAGHSVGEYTALVCAGALKFNDAIALVAARGQYMQDAVEEGLGAMAAIIGLSEQQVEDLCKTAKTSSEEVISPANFNSIGQIVIAGHKAPIERAIILAKEQGAKLATMIAVSVPSHCQLMYDAAKRLEKLLSSIKISTPELTVINNVDVAPYKNEKEIKVGLARQLYQPVQWVKTIQLFVKAGINNIIECGPGKVLTGLNKRINKNLQLATTNDLANLESIIIGSSG